MKQYDEEAVDAIVDGLQYRIVDNTVDAMARQIEGIAAAFAPDGDMDTEAISVAFAMLDRLTAEIMRRAMGLVDRNGSHDRWLAQHVISVRRMLKAMAEEREVECATVEKALRGALGARDQ